jgi:hypothetical protein
MIEVTRLLKLEDALEQILAPVHVDVGSGTWCCLALVWCYRLYTNVLFWGGGHFSNVSMEQK